MSSDTDQNLAVSVVYVKTLIMNMKRTKTYFWTALQIKSITGRYTGA